MKMIQRKRVIESTVNAKATRILQKAECGRLYGRLCNEKRINGKVLEVVEAEKGSKKQASLRVEWYLPGKTVQKPLKIGSVEAESHCASNSDSRGVNCAAAEPVPTGVAANCASEGGLCAEVSI